MTEHRSGLWAAPVSQGTRPGGIGLKPRPLPPVGFGSGQGRSMGFPACDRTLRHGLEAHATESEDRIVASVNR